ncbi:hypothetical protein MMC07_009395 [Pseudocyphellaria aurata]|nr:hypothetical protein [Pseudocyphellaria aurata]
MDNESIDDPFAIPGHARAGIFSTTSAFRTETYEEQTGRKTGACVPRNEVTEDSYEERREDTHEEGREDTHNETNPYYPFNNSSDYALALWFQDTGCTKGDVNNFFKNKLLEPFHIGLERPPPFRLGLSFKNDRIPTGVCNDDWRELELTVETELEGQVPSMVIVQYRNVINAIKFLLGHFPFASDLVYSPICQYNDDNKRVYTEMHTGDWWWNTQQKLPDGSTIVPLLIGTDKTVLTQHHGDVAAWPVYLTIGNLKAEVRRQQKRPSSLLIGFLPIGASGDSKAKIWHTALSIILEPIKHCVQDGGILMQCADGQLRKCFSIIAGFICDYEEQMMITGVKSGQHCSICEVPSDERQNLAKKWPTRTHNWTRQQI